MGRSAQYPVLGWRVGWARGRVLCPGLRWPGLAGWAGARLGTGGKYGVAAGSGLGAWHYANVVPIWVLRGQRSALSGGAKVAV